jgi:hypothetical protein
MHGENPRNENIQGDFTAKGNSYIQDRFPGLDYILNVSIVSESESEEDQEAGKEKGNY